MSPKARIAFLAPGLLLTCFASAALADDAPAATEAQQQEILKIAKDIHKAIVTLPQYGVFDNINYGIKGSTVILRGEASRPVLKSSAENVTKKIEGVSEVQNNIEVLPLSPNDDKIRSGVYASIYRYAPLQKYTSNRGPRVAPRWPAWPAASPMILRSAGTRFTSLSRMGTSL